MKFNGVKNVYRSNGDAEHNQINIVGGHISGSMNNGANSGYIGDSGSLSNTVYATKTSQSFTHAYEPDNDTFDTELTVIDDQGMVRKVQNGLCSD